MATRFVAIEDVYLIVAPAGDLEAGMRSGVLYAPPTVSFVVVVRGRVGGEGARYYLFRGPDFRRLVGGQQFDFGGDPGVPSIGQGDEPDGPAVVVEGDRVIGVWVEENEGPPAGAVDKGGVSIGIGSHVGGANEIVLSDATPPPPLPPPPPASAPPARSAPPPPLRAAPPPRAAPKKD
jgi:hypothetical protein